MKVEEKETTSVDVVITLQSMREVDMLYSALRTASLHPKDVMDSLAVVALSKSRPSKEVTGAFIKTLKDRLEVV